MIPFLITLAAFAAWWVIGLGLLAALQADTRDLRVALTAPLVGTAATVLLLFFLSHAGVAMADGAPPVIAVLLLSSTLIIVVKRPPIAWGVWPIVALAVANALLIGWPMFEFGSGWIANANDDMANYVLSATDLLHHGLLGQIDFAGLRHGRDYVTVVRGLHDAGSRPGADITLASLSAVTGRPAYQVFMPLIFALNMSGICAAGALAMQASRKWWAASLAALLLVTSPLAGFGVLAQLVPQVWGLGLAAALLALLMREDLHTRKAGVRELIPVGVLAAAFVVVYVELASTVAAAYALYVFVLLVRRRIDLRAVVRLWGSACFIAFVVLNSYLFRELHYVSAQANAGLKSVIQSAPLFGFALVPTALAAIPGLHVQNPSPTAPYTNEAILIGLALCAGAAVAALLTLRRGVAASFVLVTYLFLGIYLGSVSSDFGLFKTYMYVQPFLAAGAAVWLSSIAQQWLRWVALLGVALLITAQIHTGQRYVKQSRDPIDLPHASASDLVPTFRGWASTTRLPVISTTENPVLAKLEVASTTGHSVLFIAKDLFANFASPRKMGWTSRSIATLAPLGPSRDRFLVNSQADSVLSSGRCLLVFPTGSQTPINRYSYPEGSPDLARRACGHAPNLLVFTSSTLGEGFFLPAHRKRVSFYQLESDYFYPGHTFAGLGRFALFRILDPSASVRLELDLTTTVRQDGANRLPPADVVGAARSSLRLEGRGSARVFSRPLRPIVIGGKSYVLLDMGVNGKLISSPRSGLRALYGTSVPIDPRYLTSYVRNISLVSDAAYRHLTAPTALNHFPADLANRGLEYSGLYEDGWVAEDSYLVLAGGPATNLTLHANVPVKLGQHLDVIVNGRTLLSQSVRYGKLDVHMPVSASTSRRRVELHWTRSTQLNPPDRRRAAALLESIALDQAPRMLRRFPADLNAPGLEYRGIYSDGWVGRDSYAVLRGGGGTDLIVRAEVPVQAGRERVDILVNGRSVASRSVSPGLFALRVPIPPSHGSRRVELRFGKTIKLAFPDTRHASALLRYLGVAGKN
jgi:hypothetical protein